MSGTFDPFCAPPVPPVTGVFVGMSRVQLMSALAQLQQALIDLVSGGKPQTVTYASGEGNRSVTYTRTDESKIRHMIGELNVALGQGRRRRAIGVCF